ncbi:hypothetical protein LCGC14_0263520 [marine sediment metagenome]|uniref:Uncharacterized protein n=1 Tax=marine sediment metagenome TaxID=412755 RepID=A0A0F9UI77_9ZZZZ
MQFAKTKGDGPERISVEMLDPTMVPGVARTAVAPITVSPAGLSCQAELFLGPNDATKVATSGRKAFISTGAAQSVRLPVTMPTAGGVAYHVYLDVFVNGMRFLVYQATEDVIIPAGTVGPITWE